MKDLTKITYKAILIKSADVSEAGSKENKNIDQGHTKSLSWWR